MSETAIERHIGAFFTAFRAEKFDRIEKVCFECDGDATTFCEICEVGLCAKHADTETYSDCDICRGQKGCDTRGLAKLRAREAQDAKQI